MVAGDSQRAVDRAISLARDVLGDVDNARAVVADELEVELAEIRSISGSSGGDVVRVAVAGETSPAARRLSALRVRRARPAASTRSRSRRRPRSTAHGRVVQCP